ncbi:MAG TPA: hypothetical protein VGB66_02160 [Longimicrobium sp.]|jgi:hypothetical protein
MRSTVLALLVCLLAPASLAAQAAPPADAPLPRHVTHLLTLARDGFERVRGRQTRPPETLGIVTTTWYASTYAMKFRGVAAESEIRINRGINTVYEARLPVRDSADVRALLAAAVEGIQGVIPAGWKKEQRLAESPTLSSSVWWNECTRGGRAVSISTHRPHEESPALRLIVRLDGGPCVK